MKTETDLKYKYTLITKGSIKKKQNINTLKSNLNVLVIYQMMKVYISKANFSWSKQLIILVLRTFEFDTEKSQV